MTIDDSTPTTSTSLTPAKPSLRIKAKILDFILFFALFVIFITLGFRLSLPDIVIDIIGGSLIGLLLLYLTLSEGLWGTTIGKKNYKMRVIGPLGEVPGILRAFVRNFVISMLYVLYKLSKGLLTNLLSPGQETKPDYSSLIILFLFVLCGFVLFSTARRKNGYAGLHDLISGTRVVLKP